MKTKLFWSNKSFVNNIIGNSGTSNFRDNFNIIINEIPLKLLQSERSQSPFLGIETIEAEFHEKGKSLSQILLKSK